MNKTILDYKFYKNLTTPISFSPKFRPWDFGEISLLILVIFGAITNFLTIKVMRSKRMRNSNASLFVICMAVSDFLLLLLKFIANMIKLYRVSIYNFCVLIQVIPQAASFISVWLIIITSTERTAAVLIPLKVASLFSHKRSKIIILIMIIFFLCLSSTISVCIEYSETQPYYCKIKGNQNGTCFKYYTYIFPWFRSALGSWIPSVIGLCLNLIIINCLYKASHNRKNITYQMVPVRKFKNRNNSFTENFLMNKTRPCVSMECDSKNVSLKRNSLVSVISNGGSLSERSESCQKLSSRVHSYRTPQTSCQSKERQITIMLMTISISFFILTLPYSTFELLRKLGFKSKWLKSRNLLRLVMLLIDINHATNFILYCLTAQRFRNELKIIILRMFKRNRNDKKRNFTSNCNDSMKKQRVNLAKTNITFKTNNVVTFENKTNRMFN
ncbi:unnamed protein product [Brachionus calyciflorus]|uniref:G-protein coupled receptors family 1 profile domain-containing protein n=1 Tax=Brachionus calyciflorus TaxID=104777 RepID=A0A813XUX4_9BILA|nr:unnamed protein product [Brachionus calyciflorus]